jgi:hypothetical protein
MTSAKSLTEKCLGSLILTLLLGALTAGQSVTGSVQGKVTDTRGARISGALVTVTNPKIGVKKKGTSKDDGYFTISGLRPSTYTVIVEKAGYQTFAKPVVLEAMGRANANPINIAAHAGTGGQGAQITPEQLDLELSIVLLPETASGSGPHDATFNDGGIIAPVPPAPSQPGQNPPATNNGTSVAQAPVAPALLDAGRLQLQSLSGERSDLITNNQIRNLALNGRDLLDLMKLIPGVVSTFDGQLSNAGGLDRFNINGTRGNQHELAIDGSSAVDTGNNATRHVTINPDAVAEIKVLTANYQAEYGKAAGGFIQIVTKSGSNEFHGGARFFHRHESLNANPHFNKAQGFERPLYRYNSVGYDISGPVYLPRAVFGPLGGWNKQRDRLFFFFNQEFYRQLVPNVPHSFQTPTAKERAGDFSESFIGNSRVFIRDPLKTGDCRANDTSACFIHNGRLHVIDPARFFKDGQAILNLYPLPNTVPNSTNFFRNYSSQISQEYPRRETVLRLDYKLGEQTDLTGRLLINGDQQVLAYGTLNAVNSFMPAPLDFPRPGWNLAFTLTHSFSPTLSNEFIFGPSHNRITLDAVSERATRRGLGLTTPLLFPAANTGDFIPNFSFGGLAGPLVRYENLPLKSVNSTFNFSDNLTWVGNEHLLKFGVFVQRSHKDQTAAAIVNGMVDFNGQGETAFVDNTTHPFANALLGSYNAYQQANSLLTGRFRYTNAEVYVQDLWRINSRLALDLGVRLSWYQPQYDDSGQVYFFDPQRFDPARAVRLYEPICIAGTTTNNGFTCSVTRAVDPRQRLTNPTTANTLPQSFIGQLVPDLQSDPINGMVRGGQGYPRGGFTDRGLHWGPRFGFAYDLSGDGRTILRGGAGIFYDRVPTDAALLTNPPTIFTPRLLFGQLQTLPQSSGDVLQEWRNGALVLSPFEAIGYARDSKLPTVYSYSLNLQRDLGWGTVADVAYVGTLGRHLPITRNLNAIPFGTLFTRQAQDPSRYTGGVIPDSDPNISPIYSAAGLKFDGTRAYSPNFQNLLRPYRGYGNIRYREFTGPSNYHSLQAALRRRFSRQLTLGLAYTWSKALNYDFYPLSNPVAVERNEYRLADYDRTHVLAINYVYALPQISRALRRHWLVKGLLDNWRLSGIALFSTGGPIDPGVNSAGERVGVDGQGRFTGSYTEVPNFLLRGNPQPGPNGLAINLAALALPAIGTTGPWPSNYLRLPGINNHDLAVLKDFPLGGEGRLLQLRVELFNAFNHTQFSDISRRSFTTNSLTGKIGFSLRGITTTTDNGIYISNPCSSGPGQCFGEYSAARDPRIIQLAVKLYF